MVEETKFRRVMGHFPTGVTVVTTRGEKGAPLGLTVSAFTSVSLVPVRILICIHKDAAAHGLIVGGSSFSVNILSSLQERLAIRFASSVAEERFAGLEVLESPLGNPLLTGTLGWLDCEVRDVFPGGDHSVVLAEVMECQARVGDPLVFYRGELKGLGS
jgi:flavin reductase (DIM6/NTAB) family NADH-FMN oxidoreductase RutF